MATVEPVGRRGIAVTSYSRLMIALLLAPTVACAPSRPTRLDIAAQEHELPLDDATAIKILLETHVFTSSQIGVAGEVPNGVRAFKVVLQRPDAAAVFEDVLENGETAGQLYALCGLYLTDRDTFDREVGRFRDSNESVSVWFGCWSGARTVADLLDPPAGSHYEASILNGEYAVSFRDVVDWQARFQEQERAATTQSVPE